MKQAFTLIELLVVIAIIGVISTLSVVSFSNAREKARIAKGLDYSAALLRADGDDLLMRWDFDECSGTSVSDQSETMSSGVFQADATWSTETPNGKGCSLLLDGAGDYVTSTKGFSLANRSFTISAWAKRSTYGLVYNTIFSAGSVSDTYKRLMLVYRDTNILTCSFYGDSLDVPTAYADSNWHQVVCSYDATTKKRQVFIDGKLEASGTAFSNFIGTNQVVVGQAANGWYFDGNIDDVRVYGRALSSREVERMYAESASRFVAQGEADGFLQPAMSNQSAGL